MLIGEKSSVDFSEDKMVITQTPFRMSFFGGGTDIKEYFAAHKGAVISTTFDKYCYVNVRHLPRFFDWANELTYSKIEKTSSIEEINHPAIRNAMKMLDMKEIRLIYEADLPAKSGLGTSSSFAVGMLNAFYALKGEYADPKRLADEAIRLERDLCNEAGGWQDQIAAAYGGLNRIDFDEDGYRVNPIIMAPGKKKELNSSLVLFFTGFTRFSSSIQSMGNAGGKKTVAVLGEMYSLVDEAQQILTNKDSDMDEFGRLLDYSWKLKKGTNKAISTDTIDTLYERGIKAGALGGKLLGAGGGGFLLFYVQPEKRDSLVKALDDLLYVPFEFVNNGSRVIHFSHESWKDV